jgi:centromere protein C
VRDEHGLEVVDYIFSSPEKPRSLRQRRTGSEKGPDATISSEEDMDVGESMSVGL